MNVLVTFDFCVSEISQEVLEMQYVVELCDALAFCEWLLLGIHSSKLLL